MNQYQVIGLIGIAIMAVCLLILAWKFAKIPKDKSI